MSNDDSYATPPALCRACGYFMNRAAQFAGTEPGVSCGDIAICFNCGTPSIYDENLRMREMTTDEVALLSDEERALIRFGERNCYMRRHVGRSLIDRGGKA